MLCDRFPDVLSIKITISIVQIYMWIFLHFDHCATKAPFKDQDL